MNEPRDRIVSLQPTSGTFDFKKAPPFALPYLSTYYMQPPTADETVVSEFLIEQFRSRPPRGRFIELGCGPTIHHVFPFAPHVSEIHMADYLDENLDQVRLWRDAAPGAHDWRPYAGMTLRHEGKDPSPEAIDAREALARAKITQVMRCDLKHDTAPELRGQYDGVGCFYCVEEIGISIEEWHRVLERAVAFLRPGGTLYMAALANMKTYPVRDSAGTLVEYPCACITEADVYTSLCALGFPAHSISLRTSNIEHPDCGVTATLMVAAVKG